MLLLIPSIVVIKDKRNKKLFLFAEKELESK